MRTFQCTEPSTWGFSEVVHWVKELCSCKSQK